MSNREENKINLFIFYPEVQPNFAVNPLGDPLAKTPILR